MILIAWFMGRGAHIAQVPALPGLDQRRPDNPLGNLGARAVHPDGLVRPGLAPTFRQLAKHKPEDPAKRLGLSRKL